MRVSDGSVRYVVWCLRSHRDGRDGRDGSDAGGGGTAAWEPLRGLYPMEREVAYQLVERLRRTRPERRYVVLSEGAFPSTSSPPGG